MLPSLAGVGGAAFAAPRISVAAGAAAFRPKALSRSAMVSRAPQPAPAAAAAASSSSSSSSSFPSAGYAAGAGSAAPLTASAAAMAAAAAGVYAQQQAQAQQAAQQAAQQYAASLQALGLGSYGGYSAAAGAGAAGGAGGQGYGPGVGAGLGAGLGPGAAGVNGGAGTKRSFVRMQADATWVDPTLAEWPEGDFRLYVTDLGPEATDEMLAALFRRWPSFARARVVRDKHKPDKTKGYGFVSFLDPCASGETTSQDRNLANVVPNRSRVPSTHPPSHTHTVEAMAALREKHGAYCGGRPIKLKRSKWNEKDADVHRAKEKEREKRRLTGGV